jgi:MFS family permease
MEPLPQPSEAAPAAPASNPWYLVPWFGRQPGLDPASLRVLGLVSLGMVFENYDMGLVNAALPQISTSLGIETGDTAYYMSAIRLGGLGTFLIVPFADRFGRRRVFLTALIGMSAGTLATALAQTPLQFVAFQMVARAFLMTASVLALVILVEEFPAGQRGAGIGLLSVLGGLGFGLASGLYAAVDLLPYGWRSLYAIGILPLMLLPFFRRSLQETQRFEHAQAGRHDHGSALRAWADPILQLWRLHPRRAATVGAAGLFAALGSISFFVYTSYFVQNAHGWAPGLYTLLVLGGGLIGLLGNVLGGRGSDRLGRRRVGCTTLLLAPVFVGLFFLGPESTLVPVWGLCVLCTAAGDIVIRALSSELFGTSHRATAVAWLMLVQTLGWTLGLLVVGLSSDSLQDLARSITWISLALALAGLCLLAAPETRQRELEAISGEGDA